MPVGGQNAKSVADEVKWQSSLTVHTATETDLAAVTALEAHCFSRPWRADDFQRMLTEPTRTLLVAEADGVFCGYVGAYTVCDETDVTTVAVLPTLRGKGVGRALIGALTDKVGGRIYLEVRESNVAARALYAACGFAEYGIRKNYYENPREDAVLCRFPASAAEN